jgi:hypothetical protein
MSLAQLWPQLVTLRAEQASGSDMAWKVLYADRRQPLLVPIDTTQARRAITFFMRNPLLRYWGHMLLTLDRWLPRAQLLPTVRLEHFPYQSLFGTWDLSGAALFVGFPGPLQKLTVYCPGHNGDPGKVAKVALQPSANDAIAQEAHWLDKLNRSEPMAEFLPELLLQGTLPCGRRYISMLALPQGMSSAHFGAPHYAFLRVLAQQKPALYVWQQSEAYKRLHTRTHAVLPLIDQRYHGLLLGALAEVEQQIGNRELPASMVHGDFAPWNLRLNNGHLFVFDWEYAEACGNPLQDFLHFHLIPRALQRWPLRTRWMPGLLAKTVEFSNRMFGPDSGVAAASGALITHYLLDTVTFYIDASGNLDMQHPVINTYLRLLEERALWLPQTTYQEPGNDHGRLKHG